MPRCRSGLAVVVLALAGVAAAGCGGGTAPDRAPAVPAAASAARPSASAVKPPDPAPPTRTAAAGPPAAGAALGTAQTGHADGAAVKVTVASYRVIALPGVNRELMPAGAKIGLIQATACVTADRGGRGVGLSWGPWSALTAAGVAYGPVQAYGAPDFPGPLYPHDPGAVYRAGRCRSGIVPVALTGPDAAVTVQYDAGGVVLDWRVG